MNWTFDQLNIFVTAVEQGSFSSAARKLGRVQSRISAAISDLEVSLNFELFDRSKKYPTLTVEGKKMYSEAKAVLAQCERMKASAVTVAFGEESQIVLAMDEALPIEPFANVFTEIAEQHGTLTLKIMTGSKDLVSMWVENESADIGLVSDLRFIQGSLEKTPIKQYKNVLIVSAEHPLAGVSNPTVNKVSQYRQLVIEDQLDTTESKPISPNHWFVNHYHCIALLVSSGVGWAIVPEYIIDQNRDLKNIIKLPIASMSETLPIFMGVIKRLDHANGPVMTKLYATLKKIT